MTSIFAKRMLSPRLVLAWTLFTLSAGYVNGAAIMACRSFVTHVTGAVTNIGADPTLFKVSIAIVALFIVGGMLSVLITESLRARGSVAFVLPVLLSFVALILVGMVGKLGYFGEYGAPREPNGRAIAMLGPIVASMGMVNAAIAMATNNQIRITHLTGPATDLAGNVVRAVLGTGQGASAELRWAIMRLVKLAAFGFGAYLAAAMSPTLQYDSFSAAAGILILAVGFMGSYAEPADESAGDPDAADPDAATGSIRPLPPPRTSSARLKEGDDRAAE